MKQNELNKLEQLFKDKIEEAEFSYQEADWSALQNAMQSKGGNFWSSSAAKIIAGVLVISAAVGIAINSQTDEAKSNQEKEIVETKTVNSTLESIEKSMAEESPAIKIEKSNTKQPELIAEPSSAENNNELSDKKEEKIELELEETESLTEKSNPKVNEEKLVNSAALDAVISDFSIIWSGNICLNETALFSASNSNGEQLNSAVEWQLNGERISSSENNSTEIFIDSPGNYLLSASIDNITKEVSFTVEEMPVADFIYEEQKGVYTDKVAILKGKPIEYEYTWDIEGLESNLTGNNISIEFEEFGVYDVEMIYTTASGCSYSVTKPIAIVEDFKPFVPSHFSPNGDGTNDTFIPVGFENVEGDYTFSIFNDKGQLIFQTNDKSIAWDGENYLTGNKLSEGLFVWQVNLNNKTYVRTFTGKLKIMN